MIKVQKVIRAKVVGEPHVAERTVLQSYQQYFFFWAAIVNRQMTPPFRGEAADSVRLLLTKNPARFFSCPWCQVHDIPFERLPRP